ncbi:valine tRNA mitochondrial 1-like [Tubulinosema ratisbonensis]|uniref:valine--tRNA ligase n=1 Tax=Tubulinosema ratisbonensis TaxID=291195 RepID=A0A437AIW2_9MICR|nr:valine tRNA mitochondrial 1-like [Tubulinosema ratisbonensis]
MEIKDNYDPVITEEEIQSYWEKNKTFITKEKNDKFVMILPPPNITGKLHIGHALMISIQDCVARYERLKGKQVLFLPGTDHAGISTQTVIEKMMDAELRESVESNTVALDNLSIKESNFVKESVTLEQKFAYAKKWKSTYESEINTQLKRLGASCDFTKSKFTLDKEFNELVTDTFINLHKRKMIYRDYRLINYSCKLKSVISDLEVENKEIKGNTKLMMDGKYYKFGLMYYFYYPVIFKEKKNLAGYLEVCTTRPETIYGDTGVVLNCEDEFYKKIIKKSEIESINKVCCLNPLTNECIPIIFDSSVDKEFGTGVMKVTPGHDFNDYILGKKHNLEIKNILENNTIIFTGRQRFDERIEVVKLLKEKNLLTKIEDHDMVLPVCSRTGDIIEPKLMSQWFCDMTEARKLSLEVLDEIEFTPKESKKVMFKWIDNVKDWCLSRQLWWGHSIPAYKIYLNNEFFCWFVCKEISKEAVIDFLKEKGNQEKRIILESKLEEETFTFEITEKEMGREGNNLIKVSVVKDKDVLDTWFSSALCPLVHMNYPSKEFIPTSLLETGSDILFFWVARMIFMSVLLTNKIPFKKVLLHGLIRDSLGRKMSKSFGNVIDPLFIINGCTLNDLNLSLSKTLSKKEREISVNYQKKTFPNGIKKCGADALRFGLLNYVNDCKDVNLDIKRVEGYSRFCNKIYHMVKCYLSKLKETNQTCTTDLQLECVNWINNKFNECLKKVTFNLEKYNFMDACISLHSFILYDLCDIGLEINKEMFILNDTLLKNTLILLHPFMPFISEKMYQKMNLDLNKENKSILDERWPDPFKVFESNFDQIICEIKGLRNVEISSVEEKYFKVFKAVVKKKNVGCVEKGDKGGLVKYN